MQINTQLAKSFNKAVTNAENFDADGNIIWNFVDADLNLELGIFYSSEYLYECFEVLVDRYFS